MNHCVLRGILFWCYGSQQVLSGCSAVLKRTAKLCKIAYSAECRRNFQVRQILAKTIVLSFSLTLLSIIRILESETIRRMIEQAGGKI